MSAVAPLGISSAYGIICDGLKDVGKLRAGDVPDGEQLAEGMRRLNKLINFYMTQGCKLWLVQNVKLTLLPPLSPTQGIALYSLGPLGTVPMQKPLRVISAYYQDNSTQPVTQRPLIQLSYPDEYTRLSTLLQPGSINSYAVDKQSATINVYLWNPPDAFTSIQGEVHLMIEASVTNFLGITDQMQFPIEWSLALEWGFADQVSTGQPAMVQAKAAMMAKTYKEALEDWDVEDADTMFQPDQRSEQYRGRFR